jgi:hypothetical protein
MTMMMMTMVPVDMGSSRVRYSSPPCTARDAESQTAGVGH